MPKTPFAGLLVPAITPFDEKLDPDEERFVRVCRWLLSEGAHGLAVFGTTSEANSMSVAERKRLLEALLAAGIDPAVLLPGTGLPSVIDTVELTSHAVSLGCGGVLVLPPFYYKPVSTDGLFAFYSEVIERVGSADLGLYLYHIPQVAGVGISHDLIERLLMRYPDTVLGLKDSSGVWENTVAVLERFPGLRVFPSSEGVLLEALRRGAAGCITASGNANPGAIRALYDARADPKAQQMQERVAKVRAMFASCPLIAAVKRAVARTLGDPELARVRPPLEPLTPDQEQKLCEDLSVAAVLSNANELVARRETRSR